MSNFLNGGTEVEERDFDSVDKTANKNAKEKVRGHSVEDFDSSFTFSLIEGSVRDPRHCEIYRS